MPLIVFEGIDGSGTTTQSKRLAASKVSAQWICQPTQGVVGCFVREVFNGKYGPLLPWRTMLHLFQADREMHVKDIRRWLSEGRYVVSDRYWLSTMCYQTVSAAEEDGAADAAADLIESVNVHLPQPDVTLVLDVSVEEALRRKNEELDHYEQKDFLEKVRQNYLRVGGVRRIDTMGKSEDEVFELVNQQLAEAGF